MFDILSACIGAAGVWAYSKLKNSKKLFSEKENDVNKKIIDVNKNLNKTSLPNSDIPDYITNLINNHRNIFITGGAGTGKSYLLQQIKKQYPSLILTSTTGVSAININGQTIHSWSGIGIANQTINTTVNKIKNNKVTYKQIVMCEMLAIDEISMLDSETMKYIDTVLRKVREKNLPFGGIQTILIGDFFQLPPVKKNLKDSDFCFNSQTWKELNLAPVVLKEVKRQTDKEFINMLNNLREGKTNLDDLKIIWQREESVRDFVKSKESQNILKLFSTNESADNYNLTQLATLDYKEYPFLSEDKINWCNDNNECFEVENIDKNSDEWKHFDKDCKAPLKLQLKCDLKLKTGCRVMLLHNLDVANGLANGSCGTVVNIKPNEIDVLFDGINKIVPIQRVNFEITINSKSKIIKRKNEVGIEEEIELTKKKIVRKQFPLRLAYGITIHKSQGMTFDQLIVDCGKIFADGQAYVALSRTRSLQGLYPINFDNNKVVVNKTVLDFYKKLDEHTIANSTKNIENIIKNVIKNHQKLKITYQSNPNYKNEITTRTIIPERLELGLTLNKENRECNIPFEDNVLYIVAFCELRKEKRTFRVEGIQSIEIIK